MQLRRYIGQKINMIIEWLTFQVEPTVHEKFIYWDAQIWTPVLAKCPGFLGKEVWVSPQDHKIICIVRWATRDQWKAISQKLLEETETKFAAQMGNTYILVEEKEYQMVN